MLLSKLSLGTAQFGLNRYGISAKNRVPSQDIGPILELARRFGIYTIDTSPSYGNAEQLLGQYDLTGFHIITKTLPKQPSADTVLMAFLASLEHMKVSKVHGLLIHQMSDQNVFDQVEILKSLKQRGYVDKIGVSVYSPYELRSALRRFEVDIVSFPLNVFDQRFIEMPGLIDELVERKVEVHSRSAFLQGAVFLDPMRLPAHLEPLKEKLATLTPHMALEFIKRQLFVDYCTIGIEGLEQFIDTVSLWNNDLTTAIDYTQFRVEDIRIINPSFWPVS